MTTLFSLANKVCVMTGGARGLGNVMLRGLIEAGATQAVILDLREDDAAAAAAELATDYPGIEAEGYAVDVAVESSVVAAFDRIKNRFGRVDVLVTSAGICENFPAEGYPAARMQMLMDINVNGSWFCAVEAYKLMLGGGSIIMIGSMSGSVVNIPQKQTPYNMSKAAVRHMVRSLAVEWADKGVRVNCISPGYMLTNLTKVIMANDPPLRDAWLSRIPAGRMGDPDDLKGAVVYLASNASKYTTGSELVVDGGYTCV